MTTVTNEPTTGVPGMGLGEDGMAPHNNEVVTAQLKEFAREGINAIRAGFIKSDLATPAPVQNLGGDSKFYKFEFTYGPLCGNILAYNRGNYARPFFDIVVGGHKTYHGLPYMVQSAHIHTREEAQDILIQEVSFHLENCLEHHVPTKAFSKC